VEEELPPLSVADQEEAISWLSRAVASGGFRLLLLGSTALVLGWALQKTSKDVDVHPFPVGQRWEAFFDRLSSALEREGGHLRIEPDGASMTAFVPTRAGLVPVEVIEGREDFISPAVLADAVRSARQVGEFLVPSAEHLLVMKAEAYSDRTGPARAKFGADILEVVATCFGAGAVNEHEVNRLLNLRPVRKREAMARVIQDALGASLPTRTGAKGARPSGQAGRRKPARKR